MAALIPENQYGNKYKNMIKGIFSKTYCFFNGHQFENWEVVEKENCLQRSVCSVCKRKESFRNHDWSNWEYLSDDSCDQLIRCKTEGCNEKKERKFHPDSKTRVKESVEFRIIEELRFTGDFFYHKPVLVQNLLDILKDGDTCVCYRCKDEFVRHRKEGLDKVLYGLKTTQPYIFNQYKVEELIEVYYLKHGKE